MKKRMNLILIGVAVAWLALPVCSFADAFYSQTPPSTVTGHQSDSAGSFQAADDFLLPTARTLRNIAWRGFYASDNTPAYPLSFDLIVYGDSANLPNPGSVIASTSVVFPSASTAMTDTGLLYEGTYPVYQFTANVPPVALAASTQYWLSVYANTANDANDDFYWTNGNTNSAMAVRVGNDSSFSSSTSGPLYFVLNDAPVPEPASLALFGLAGLALARRRPPLL